MEATGDMVLSKTAVSKVTDILWKEFEEFQEETSLPLLWSISSVMRSTSRSAPTSA